MNTIRTISAQFTLNTSIMDFYLDIPFEVDMVKLVDTRSYGVGVSTMSPRISFLPNNQVVCLANKTGFPANNQIEFWFNRATPLIGTYYISNDVVGDTAKPTSYLLFVFEFWSFKAGLPRAVRPTNWQQELISVSSIDNSFSLDIRFPVDEIIIENCDIINFNLSTQSSLIFYSDFLPSTPTYVKNIDPLVGTDYVSNNLSKARVSSGVIGVVHNTYYTNPVYRYKFEQPITIRGNYRIWNQADPQPYPASLLSPVASGIWDNIDIATFFVKFISYR